MKSTVEQIRRRFDNDVERFSNLETGQSTIIDAPQVMDLVTQAAVAASPAARKLLGVGCGAGNYLLKLLQKLPDLDVTRIDLNKPMLEFAVQRIKPLTHGVVTTWQGDIRLMDLEKQQLDVILAAAILHHLRTEVDWREVFEKFYLVLKPGGSLWTSDLVEHSTPAIQAMIWQRYGEYLRELRDEAYQDTVFAYIEQEDTPRSLLYQIDLMRSAGFVSIDVLHKNGPFAAYGGIKM